MFTRTVYTCPTCEQELRKVVGEESDWTCPICERRFELIRHDETGTAALVAEDAPDLPEPLYLPRGSIRAGVALLMAGVSWLLIAAGRPVPGPLLSLLLTIVGYYFGFRTEKRMPRGNVFDAEGSREHPLFLPGGAVRLILLLGFLVTGLALLTRGRLMEDGYLEFYFILLGLFLGHLFARITGTPRPTAAMVLFNHVKGAAVLAASLALVILFLTEGYLRAEMWLVVVMCGVVGFYYGSRS